VIYDRATIYRVTMPTDDCFRFLWLLQKKKIPKEDFSRTFFCSYRLATIFLYARRFAFFSKLFIKSASLPLKFDFFLQKKKGKERNSGCTKGNEGAAWDNGSLVLPTTANHAFNFYGIFGLKRQAHARAPHYVYRAEFSFCGIFIRTVKSLWLADGREKH